ncbi:myb-like protein X isoform X2 [Leptopilina boulardi]|uniref:myb-like protein X isoform X2 n=1 Tax=Leptopilina boulardi TaxID=63433 RepID=UPI0021F5D011|nr:myb-like protein X isoform X2 [Leptopilina boulardi]
MIGRTSLLDQKKLQWAKERELGRLGGNWGPVKVSDSIRSAIRTRICLTELNGKHPYPLREGAHYGSTMSLRSLASDNSGICTSSVQNLDFSSGSLINLHDRIENHNTVRRRSPSLPPIHTNKEQYQHFIQEQKALGVDGLRYQPKPQKYQHRHNDPNDCHPYEEKEGETSGYASDSVEATVTSLQDPLMSCKSSDIITNEKTWQNPYYTTDESSLPPSRRIISIKAGEFNRQRWGSIWGQDPLKGDPPPPSWLERGLSRLDHSSQVLVINHDSASSPDSSTTGSTGSSSNKTYLRGQNLPIDANVLQERETRRQKAVELQNAIKQQLEERERQRRSEKERKLREEREEEERIKKERDKEKERLEEEQRRQKDKEIAKQKKAEAMREVIEAAERLAKEEKKLRRKRNVNENNKPIANLYESNLKDHFTESDLQTNESQTEKDVKPIMNEENHFTKIKEIEKKDTFDEPKDLNNSIRIPVSKDVAIVLSGRLDDPELLNKANLQVVNFVMTPTPRKNDVNHILSGLNAIVNNNCNSNYVTCTKTKASPRFVENRLLTPSKYRTQNSRDCGTQTDTEKEIQDLQNRIHEIDINNFSKESKDAANNNQRDVEKSTSTSNAEEMTVKTLPRAKKEPRTSLESRPRWNANRPGTRYRTQSEKDPHYQRRMRLRRNRVESSDEGSRSPSPDLRKNNSKQKTRSLTRRKTKLDSYDADLSMDSLNSTIPLRFDENGRINIVEHRNEHGNINKYSQSSNYQSNILKDNVDSQNWCGQEILSHLSSLRNGLLIMQKQSCPVSPITELY